MPMASEFSKTSGGTRRPTPPIRELPKPTKRDTDAPLALRGPETRRAPPLDRIRRASPLTFGVRHVATEYCVKTRRHASCRPASALGSTGRSRVGWGIQTNLSWIGARRTGRYSDFSRPSGRWTRIASLLPVAAVPTGPWRRQGVWLSPRSH